MRPKMRKSKKKGSVFWIKGLCGLLVVMMLFTVVSKVADSFTVPKVSVSSPSARKLQYTVSAEGTVVKNREISVMTEPDVLVKSVLASVSQRVKKGDVLARLDLEQLHEQMEKLSGEKRALELQNEAIETNRRQAERMQEKQKQERQKQQKLARKKQRKQDRLSKKKQKEMVRRARRDYQLLQKENQLARRQAEREIQRAETELAKAQTKFEKKQTNADGEPEVTEDMLEKLRDAVTEKKEAYEQLKLSFEQAEKKAKEAIQDAKDSVGTSESADNVDSADALSDGGAADEDESADEDMESGQEADNSTDINDISIQELENRLNKLREIEQNKGKVLAPRDGVITEILVNVGQKTLDTAMFTMTDDEAGLKFVGKMAKEDAGRAAVGDKVALHSARQDREGIAIASIEMDESGESMNVTAFLPADTFSLGETVTMRIVQESENYPCTVPLSALRQDSGKYYVLLLQKEDTILGSQELARKTEVSVLEKNGEYAALEAGSLDAESRIIMESSRFVESGDRVRLKEE